MSSSFLANDFIMCQLEGSSICLLVLRLPSTHWYGHILYLKGLANVQLLFETGLSSLILKQVVEFSLT